MSQTVHERRNEIRASVGRFEREVTAQFTKEELAAIAEALGDEPSGGRPSKGTMQAEIRRRVGLAEETGSFTKADLEAIAEALDAV
jgi:ATP-dependent Clp protease ATP-binding subunit ClpA